MHDKKNGNKALNVSDNKAASLGLYRVKLMAICNDKLTIYNRAFALFTYVDTYTNRRKRIGQIRRK